MSLEFNVKFLVCLLILERCAFYLFRFFFVSFSRVPVREVLYCLSVCVCVCVCVCVWLITYAAVVSEWEVVLMI